MHILAVSILLNWDCMDTLHKAFTISNRSELSETTKTLCLSLMKSRGMDDPHWIQALPLYHFLQELCKPFGKLKLRPLMRANFQKAYHNVRNNPSADIR